MLKDYPEHVERLQQTLNRIIEKPMRGTPPFERAIWLLEGCLETFIFEARDELDAAEERGDAEAIAPAEEKIRLMFRARSGGGGMLNLEDLWAYFQAYKEAFK
ncbi:hypothetical protein EBB59_03020 [Lysobacter pythonis]|uniref:Uncharacterized protein n=2 Tax=Solilutibacter pythonis TaxID=2483112 RepID=A0A3M2I6Z2_9GAMM|nr:hypothetical protein EBB59_03020 [Lysobacter pythonis]